MKKQYLRESKHYSVRPSQYGPRKMSWLVLHKRLSKLHGTQCEGIIEDITHVVVETWLLVMKK